MTRQIEHEPSQLTKGIEVRFARDRRWWRVRAADARFAVLTRQAEFEPAGTVIYTIVDLHDRHRGPCNLSGGGWAFTAETLDEDAHRLLSALNSQLDLDAHCAVEETSPDDYVPAVEISHRNRVPLQLVSIRAGRSSACSPGRAS